MFVKYNDEVLKRMRQGSKESAGYDIATVGPVIVPPGCFVKVHTGVSVQLPEGWQAILTHRSGLNAKKGGWAHGIIDQDYRGELIVTLFNHHPNCEIRLEAGEYFAQLVPFMGYTGELIEAYVLDETSRGEGRHGSSGK